MFHLRVLGSPDLRTEEGNGIRSILAQPKRFALLTYVSMEADPTVTRDQILGVFWPELDERRARAALSQALYHLRRSLGPHWVTNVGDHLLHLDRTAFTCDAHQFLADAQAGRARAALEVYRGPFLQSFQLDDAWAFTEWATIKAQQLGRLAEELSEQAAALDAGDGRGGSSEPDSRMRPHAAFEPRPGSDERRTRSIVRRPRTLRSAIAMLGLIAATVVAVVLASDWDASSAGRGSTGLAPPPREAHARYQAAVDLFGQADRQAETPEHVRSVQLLQEALVLAPDYPEALSLLGILTTWPYPRELLEHGRSPLLDSAQSLVGRAAELAPDRPMVLAARGLIDSFRGRLASEHHRRVLDMGIAGPARGISAVFYAHDLTNEGSVGRAAAVLEAATGHYPMNSQRLWRYAAWMAYLDPIAGFERLADIRSRLDEMGYGSEPRGRLHRGFYGNMAWVLLVAGEYDRAAALADSAILVEGHSAVFRAIPGDIAFFRGDLVAAEAHYRAALPLVGSPPFASDGHWWSHTWARSVGTSLGAILVRTGRREEGERLLRQQWAVSRTFLRDRESMLAEADGYYSVWNTPLKRAWENVEGAAIQANLGNIEGAVDLLLDADPRFVAWLVLVLEKDPLFEPLARDDRFRHLLDQLQAIRLRELEEMRQERADLGLS